MASSTTRPGGIAQLRSRLPEIIAELPPLSFESAMRVAENTAQGATERATAQYQGDFNIEAEAIDATGTEVHQGQEMSGTFVTGNTLSATSGAHVLHGKAAGVYADWWWFFGEFGTAHGQAAKPFMIPAFEQARTSEWPAAAAVFNKGLEGFGI